ncbi:hypothetical protein FOA43_003423 [Brettanomyces nanus]|uniref:Alcohol acetyltransferase n=1 Tax=Eeniella nana TaxID=13502 RepID=A0A875RW41_EENNA|nr:uncharacterized protein FOA43_003423 [Brettanomyces nanus]QPG76037.1 hypothetical protein FOA43_003423 [Brettanomyces nanus]
MPSRTLGGLEKYCFYRNYYNYYTCVISVASYSSDVDPSDLCEALKGLLVEETGFALTIKLDRKENPEFILLNRILYTDLVEYRDEDSFDLDGETTKLLDTKFSLIEGTQPLWKVIVFNRRHIVFVADHTVCDGTGIINFQRLLLKHINTARNIQNKIVPSPSSIVFTGGDDVNFMDHTESYFDSKPSISFVIRKFAERLLPGRLWNIGGRRRLGKYKLLGTNLPIPQEIRPSLHTKSRSISIDRGTLSKLLCLTKKHRVKLTSLLTYLLAKSFVNVLPQEMKRYDLPIHIPVNCRQFIDFSAIQIEQPWFTALAGTYAGDIQTTLPAVMSTKDDSIDWEYVQAVQSRISEVILDETPQYSVGMFNMINMRNYVKAFSGNFNGIALGISNVGYFDFNATYENMYYKVEDIWFTQCSGVSGALITANVVGFSGGLRITLSYDQVIPYADKVDEIIEQMRKYLVS